MDIGELADAAGLTRRAIRFYVQRGLLPAPLGVGRGRHYDWSHLDRLRRLQALQSAGHSLDAIKQIFVDGSATVSAPLPSPPESGRRAKPTLSAELWTRLRVAQGVELHFDASRHQPDVEQLRALRDAIRDAFSSEPEPSQDDQAPDDDGDEPAV